MAYTFNVSGLVDYVNEFKTELIAKPFAIGNCSKEWDLVTGNKHTANINYMEEDIVLQCGGSCTFNPDGSTVFTKKPVSVVNYKVNQQICYETLDPKWLGVFSNQGASVENSKLTADYVNNKIEKIAQSIEDLYWNGEASGTTCEFDGIIKQLEGAADREVVSVLTGVTITSANVIASVQKMYLALPKSIKRRDDLRLYVSDDIYDLYIVALNTANLYQSEFGDANTREYKIMGTKVVMKAVEEFETQLMILTFAKNFQKHTDMENEYEQFYFERVPLTTATGFVAQWKAGIGIKFTDLVVTNF